MADSFTIIWTSKRVAICPSLKRGHMGKNYPRIVEVYPPTASEVDKRDRFGLPVVSLSLLSSERKKQEISDIFDALLRDVVAAGVRHLGEEEVRHRMAKNLPAKPRGQPPDQGLRKEIIAEYMHQLEKDPKGKRHIPARMAKKKYRLDPLKQSNFIRQINRVTGNETIFRFPKAEQPSLLQLLNSDKKRR
jgi:hypothetical protein